MSGDRVRFGRYTVQVSNRDKVLFPGDGITKGDLIEYYARIARWMLPHVAGRPLAMERFPNGIEGERVFQKDVPGYFPPWIRRVRVRKAAGSLQHPLCENAASLAYLANQACITPHAWLSRADRLDHPDQLIFDLDPEGDDFEAARAAARSVRSLLDDLRLPAFLKTSGGKGLHVQVPLDRREDFDAVHSFARDVAEVLAAREPDRLTTEFRKAKREGRLFLDVGRNAYAQTAVPPYAVRPRPGAPVATPIAWEELDDPKLRPGRFTIRSVFGRLEDGVDPWKGMNRKARSLAQARRRLGRIRSEDG
jgi:bifunctional non-homologous end joining protein LigD